jgi:hypothetical protein
MYLTEGLDEERKRRFVLHKVVYLNPIRSGSTLLDATDCASGNEVRHAGNVVGELPMNREAFIPLGE